MRTRREHQMACSDWPVCQAALYATTLLHVRLELLLVHFVRKYAPM